MTAERKMRSRSFVLAVLAFLAVALGACNAGEENIEVAPTVEQSPEITDITDPFFGSDAYIGQQVTVTGEVTQVITPTSFVLTGEEYGDDSLLVLSAANIDAEVGREVTVTGTVRKFTYESYADDYELSDDAPYAGFNAEQFLVATASPAQTPTAGAS